MKRSFLRIGSCLLSVILLLSGVMGVFPLSVSAASSLSMTYTFHGNDAAKPGYCEGTITITPESGAATSGYYLLYFADSNGLLSGYDEFASIPITGSEVTYTVKEGTLLPPSATKLVVFESSSAFLETPPSYDQHLATVYFSSKKQLTLPEPSFSFGAISDVHMNYEYYGRGSYQKWEDALNFFAEQGMDKVIVSGDMTGDEGEYDHPLSEQYTTYVDIIKSSNYPLEDVYECIGNHGNTPVGRTQFVQYTGGADEVHPTADSPWFSVMVEGKTEGDRDNLFLFMAQELTAPGMSAAIDNFSKEQIDWLEGMLKTYGDTDTNIYLLEHSPFLNYGAGDRHPGDYKAMVTFSEQYPQNMRLKGLLETYKNVIHLSGHTHLTLYDNENYSTENGAFCRSVHVPSGCWPATYKTASGNLGTGDGRQTMSATYGSEAYTVRVYDDCIVFTGHNLSTGKIIPSACYIMPVERTPEPGEVFEGAGTLSDPYLIRNAADFQALTDGFNDSGSSVVSEMYGYGAYFLQTADIDMTGVAGYSGTTADSAVKTFFAGNYNGAGHTLTVDIQESGIRSVFPYTYGTVANLHFKGRIVADDGAQPIRSLYGNAINCLVDMQLSAERANGLLYSNYSYSYNIYTHGTLEGNLPDAFSTAEYSDDLHNVYHWHALPDGTAVTDAQGVRSNDVNAIAAVFNDRTSEAYQTALTALGGMEMEEVAVADGELVFAWTLYALGDVDCDGTLTTVDARLVVKDLLRSSSALTTTQRRLADMDENGHVNSRDLREMLGMLIV